MRICQVGKEIFFASRKKEATPDFSIAPGRIGSG